VDRRLSPVALSCLGAIIAICAGSVGTRAAEPPVDADGDGWVAPLDCQDRAPSIHPEADEVCNGLDDDCDGVTDEGCAPCEEPGAGHPSESPGLPASTGPYPALTWTGDHALITWSGSLDSQLGIFCRSLDRHGRPLGPIEMVVRTTRGRDEAPAGAWSGETLGLAFQSSRVDNWLEIFFVPVDAEGRKLAGETRISDWPLADSRDPAIAWSADRFGVAWADSRHDLGAPEIYFRAILPAGTPVGDEIRVTSDAEQSIHPAIAASPDTFGIAWIGLPVPPTPGQPRVLFVPVDRATGKVGVARAISSGQVASSWAPGIAWNGNTFGLLWLGSEESSTLRFREVTPDGQPAGPEVDLGVYGLRWHLAWAGDRYLVTWDTDDGTGTGYDPWRLSLARDGTILDPPAPIERAEERQFEATAAWTGNGYVAAWRDYRGDRFHVRAVGLGCGCAADLDGDTWMDCVDCDDGDPGAWDLPREVSGLLVTAVENGVSLAWDPLDEQAGPGTGYDVLDQPLSRLRPDGGFAAATCAADGVPGPSWEDSRPGPGVGEGRGYLVRGQNGCGAGTWGDGTGPDDPRDPLDEASPCP